MKSHCPPPIITALVVAVALALPNIALASDWVGTGTNWSSTVPPNAIGWSGTVPNAPGAVANHSVNTASATTVDGNYTVGTISYNTTNDSDWIIRSDATASRTITLNQDGAGSGNATISSSNSSAVANNFLDFRGADATHTLTLNLADNLLINVTGTGSISGNGAIRFGLYANISGNGDITLTNNTFNMAGALGTIYFQSANSYTGKFKVEKGSVIFTSGGFAGNAANLITLGSAGSDNASLLGTGAASTSNPWETAAGNTGSLVLGRYGTGTNHTTFSGTGVLNSNLILQSNAGSGFFVTLDGIVSGTGGITTTGSGESRLTKANTYSGNTKVNGVSLRLDNTLALQNSAYDTSGSGVLTLNTGVTTPTLGGLIGSKDITTAITTNYSAVTSLTLNPNTGKSYTYSGVIANGAAGMTLTKSGTGTQTLSGANTYTGGTTIAVGTLLINNATDSGLGTGAVSVTSGGALGGTGFIVPTGANGISVASGGFIAPGASIGTLTFNLSTTTGTVNMAGGSSFKFELGTANVSIGSIAPGSSDLLALVGANASDMAFSGNNVDFLGTGTSQGWYKVFDTDSDNANTWTGLTFNPTSGLISSGLTSSNFSGGPIANLYIGTTGNGGHLGDIYLNVVPEPTTMALLAGSLGLLFLRRRRA